MGQNDISIPLSSNVSYSAVIERIPSILSRIKDAIESIYKSGGRKIRIYNTGPLGCLPQQLGLLKKNDSELDAVGWMSCNFK